MSRQDMANRQCSRSHACNFPYSLLQHGMAPQRKLRRIRSSCGRFGGHMRYTRCMCSLQEAKGQWSASPAAFVALMSLHMACAPLEATAFEIGDLQHAKDELQEKVRDKLPNSVGGELQKTFGEQLQNLSAPASKEPENFFDRLLQPKTHGDKKEKDKLAKEKEREYKQREKKEKEKKDKIKKEQERIKKERDRLFKQQAILGGSALGIGALFIGKWQAIAAGAAILFRTLGGPTIMSNLLRTPGLLFGRSIRVVEWDVAKSPHVPNGRVVSFKLRALTPVGLRQAIVKNCGLADGREVKQICHWIQCGPGFCEPLTSVPAFRMLADPSWIVWSRRARKGLDAIPYRLDANEIAMLEQNPFGLLMPQQELELLLRTINAAAAKSRGAHTPPIQRHGLGRKANSSSDDRNSVKALSQVSSSAVTTTKSSENGRQNDPNPASASSWTGSSNGSGSGQAAGLPTADAVGSAAQRSYCEEFEKGINQAAMARQRSIDRREGATQNGSGGSPDSAREVANNASGAVGAVTRPVQQLSQSVGEAIADPVAATRDALGVPTQDCQPSPGETLQENLPGPSTGGKGAEFRETPAQLDRYQVAAEAMEKLIAMSAIPADSSPISELEEERLIALAVTSSSADSILHLFRIYASENVVDFVRFSRALLAQGNGSGFDSAELNRQPP